MRHFNSNFMHINISKNWITSASERWSEGHLAMARHAVSQHCALICQSSTKIYAFLWIENWHVVVQFNLFFCIWGWKSIEMRGERKMKFQFLKRNFRFLFFFISFFALTISISLYFLCVFFLDMEAWWRNILIKFSSIKWFFFLIWIKITNSQQICVCDTFFSLSLSFFSSLTAHLFLSSWFTWQLTQKNLLSFIISCMFD